MLIAPAATAAIEPARRLKPLDRCLTVRILAAMAGGTLVPGVVPLLDRLSVGATSIQIAVGLILMM
jgi:ACR3 family arsenite transporter